MEKQYIAYDTGAGCLVALIGIPVGVTLSIYLMLKLPQNTFILVAIPMVIIFPILYLAQQTDNNAKKKRGKK